VINLQKGGIMSVIFQLFCAEDLKQLTEEQVRDLRDRIGRAVQNSHDPTLKASLVLSGLIQGEHMPQLLPRTSYQGSRPRRSVNIAPGDVTFIPQKIIEQLRKRLREVFQQLTSELPSGQSSAPTAQPRTPAEVLYQLLSQEDLEKLERKAGPQGYDILAWALTCEIANFKTFEALQSIKKQAEEIFMQFMKDQGKGEQRPKGPDTLYSPFYPLSPLYGFDYQPPNP
jgi:hypothetical protein